MTGPSGIGSSRTWVGIASALLLALFAPSSARAGCGDHVQFGPTAGVSQPKVDPSIPPAAPCHGPSCSQRESDPMPAPAPAPSTNHYEPASLLPLAALTGGDSVERLAQSEPSYSTPLSSSVFHPPRS
jgi:hypothetical protein